MKPRLTVWTSRALGGKTRRCIQRCLQDAGQSCLLLPSDLQAQMARAILMAEGMSSQQAEKTARSLSSLAAEVANRTGSVHLIPVYLRRWLLRQAIRAAVESDRQFQHILQREGVLTLLSSWVQEMAREGVSPEELEQLAHHSLEPDKIACLSRLLHWYRRLLASHHWHEEDDIYLLAARVLQETPKSLSLPRRLLLDGFARFSQRELEFLLALAQAGHEVVVTLCWEADREALFEITNTTLLRLQRHFEVVHQPVTPEADKQVSPTIEYLAEHLFRDNPPNTLKEPYPPAVEIWEMPNSLTEIEWIAREIRRLFQQGIAWAEMAILCRHLTAMLPALQGVLMQFGVPFQIFETKPLGEHPLTRTLSTFIHLHENNYSRNEMLSWLKSGYLPIDLSEADLLRRQAVRQGVREGAERWLRLTSKMQGCSAAQLVQATIEHCQTIAQTQSPREWLDALQRALNAVGFAQSDMHAQDSEVLLHALEVAQQVVSLLEPEALGTPSEWARSVEQSWAVTPQRLLASPRNAVWLLEATRSRPLRPRVVFVMGMQEGRFPKRPAEDPLLRDEDRHWLNTRYDHLLALSMEDSAMERLGFYQAVTCATQRVILTYARTERDRDAQPSFYLQSICETLSSCGGVVQRSSRLSDVSPPLAYTIDDRDTERILVDSLFDFNPHTRRVMDDIERLRTAQELHRWLTARSERCQQWWQWRYLPHLPALVAHKLSATRRAFSPTELEEMRRCPFRHFVRWEMKLRGETTHYAAGQGRWLHAVLHRRHRRPEQPLAELLQEATRQHPVDRSAGEQHLLLQQVEEMVRSVLQREEQLYAAFGLQTLWTEVAFGATNDEEHEEEQTFPPLRLTLPDGRRMQICGRIDRVDVCPDTRAAMLIDYKRDLPREWWQHIQAGIDLQTVLYVAALRQIWKLAPAAVALDGALEGKRYRVLFLDSAPEPLLRRLGRQPQEGYGIVQRVRESRWKAIERKAIETLQTLLEQLESGDILPRPGEHCDLCEYGGICRTTCVAETPVHDGEPYPINL
jgi:ATP-dependent helicase/nuclease subunit B